MPPARLGEAVGEFGPGVGEDGVDRVAKGLEEAFEAGGKGGAGSVRHDLDMDETGGALDGDEDIGRLLVEARQVLQVDMDIAEGFGVETLGGRFGLRRSNVFGKGTL